MILAIENESIAVVSLSATVVTALVSVIIPVITGLVTKAKTSSTVKGLISIALNAINSAIVTATVADGTAVWSKSSVFTWIVGTVVSLATYLNVYKPAGITSTPGVKGAKLNG